MPSENHFGLDGTKPVVGDSDKPRLKPVSSATETSLKIEFSMVASLDMKIPKANKPPRADRYSRAETHLKQQLSLVSVNN